MQMKENNAPRESGNSLGYTVKQTETDTMAGQISSRQIPLGLLYYLVLIDSSETLSEYNSHPWLSVEYIP